MIDARRRSIRRQRRSGALIICVLVCMLVAVTLVGTAAQLALRSRREVRTQQQMLQTELLLDAGVLRAAQQLELSADYQGESWRPVEAIESFETAVVVIRVSDGQDAGEQQGEQQGETPSAVRRRVLVTASLGVAVDDVRRSKASQTKRSHEFTITTSTTIPETSKAE